MLLLILIADLKPTPRFVKVIIIWGIKSDILISALYLVFGYEIEGLVIEPSG